jgi:hypothetical protein
MKRHTMLLAGFAIAALIAVSGCSKKKADDTQAQPVAAKAAEGAAVDQAPAVAAEAQPAAAPDEKTDQAEAAGAAGGMTREQVADTTVTMMDQMAAAVTSNQGNCDGMADALQTLIDKNKPMMDQGKEVFKNDPTAKQWFEENYKAKVVASMTTMIQGMQGCEGNEKIKKVFAHVNE